MNPGAKVDASVTPFHEPLVAPGDVVADKYRIDAVVGRGGMSTVYRATHLHLDQLVAIKVLSPAALVMPEYVARLKREARAATRIRSQHVVRIFDIGELPGRGVPYLVMEHLTGADLAAVLARRGPLPVHLAVECILQVCEALAEAHALGIIHRDLKPANLFRSRQGLVYVLDFGLARALQPEEDTPISSINTPLGTLGFMAPEQAQGRWDLIAPTTDLYAVAATLLKLATGLDVYDATDPHERFLLSTTRPAPPLTQRGVALPIELCRILDRGLAFAQRDRWESAKAFREALERWQDQLHAGPIAPARELPPWLLRTAIAVGGALIGVLIAYVWLALRK